LEGPLILLGYECGAFACRAEEKWAQNTESFHSEKHEIGISMNIAVNDRMIRD
jgi:hypothetical protein